MSDPMSQLGLRFVELQLLTETPHGQVYAGKDFTGAAVTVAVLSEAAAADPATRNAFSDVVWRHSPGAVPDHATVYAADLHASRPWAAIRSSAGQPGAEQLLAGLGAAPGAMPGSPAQTPASGTPTSGSPVPGPPPPTPPAFPPPTSPAFPPPSSPGYPPAASPAFPPPAATPAGPSATPAYGTPGGPGYPAPPPSQPERASSGWPWLIGVAAAVLVLALATVATVVGVRLYQDGQDDRSGQAAPPPPPPAAPPPPPQPTAGPGQAPSPLPGEPELRDVEPISLLGPVWEDGEDTYTMSFPGWPFAFRTPRSWGCLAGSYDPIPEAPAWFCINESDPENGQRVNIMLWECPTTCTPDEQQDMIEIWLDDPEDAVRPDDLPVAYVEYEENTRGNYAIDLSFFGGAGGEVRWHIGVYLESPMESRDVVLKILNDILSQSA